MKKFELIKRFKKYTPNFIRKFVRSNIKIEGYSEFSNSNKNPFANDPDEILFSNSKIKVGIIYSRTHYHKFWIAACRDLEVSYRIIYLERFDWLQQLLSSKIDILLSWPDISNIEIKSLHDERLTFANNEIGMKLYPSLNEILLYENKRLQNYWLEFYNFPKLKTDVFFSYDDAKSHLERSNYPIVFKSNLGASASGVYIIDSKQKALKFAKDFLKNGYKLKGSQGTIRQKGGLYIQEYKEDLKEWRMVRIGESYFGHGKDMKGQFHSGSGKANWDMPPKKAFDLLHDITEKGNFLSMDVDMFEDENGNFYVNELQTVFGNSIAVEQLKINNIPGRMLRNQTGEYVFQEGQFCLNHLCNLRLQNILQILQIK
jgi:glutathione synthase/RimK-type ligase-like ATP-grasp enzyme